MREREHAEVLRLCHLNPSIGSGTDELLSLKVLAIIPARGGSKGIPRKNLREVNGVPLVAHTIRAAQESKFVERTIVSTDDEEIAKVASHAGAEVPFMRPGELATDLATLDSVVDHVLDSLLAGEGYEPNAHMILQPTNPLRVARHIDEAVQLLVDRHAGSVVSVSPPSEHPAEMAVFDNGKIRFPCAAGAFESGIQRQAYEPYLFVNGAIYLTSTDAYRTQKKRLAEPVYPYIMDRIDGFDIDEPDDLLIADILMRNHPPKTTQ